MKSDEKTPKHIAFIMDGNGRWATARNLPRTSGHKEGINAMMRATEGCIKRGVKYSTFYAFSTENKNRPLSEIFGLKTLIERNFASLAERFYSYNLKLNVIGDVTYFGDKICSLFREAEERTEGNTGGVVNIALNYGGRDEIERAAKLCGDGKISDFLYTAGQPDPDILIRTGGEKRLSNFMLYQLAYTELFFSDTYWPDFTTEELNGIIDEYYKRNRRFGK